MNSAKMEILSTRVFPVSCETLFDAFADPRKLVQWWGPHGFTNRIEHFDLRPGGEWRLVMTNSAGEDFHNHSTFETVNPGAEIRYLHHGPIHEFTMAMHYSGAGDEARLTWRMTFARTEENLGLKTFIAAANEQNFDRLQAFLEGRPLDG